MCKKHPEVIRQGSKIDLEDLHRDPVVMWQHRYYFPLTIVACLALPTIIPCYFWYDDSF